MLQEFTELKPPGPETVLWPTYLGQSSTPGGYFAASTGKVIEEYIRNQDKEPPDEDFKIHDEP